MEKFKALGITEELLKAIVDQRFEVPSEIQEKSIPLILEGKDVIGGSSTGSGKTLAFAAGIIHNVVRAKGLQALILTPTRELAEQITKAIHTFAKYKPLRIVQVYGGVSINPQIEAIYTADVVVATPGRLLDHLERKTISLSQVKILVLDEADRMLDMGFIEDVEQIIKLCPRERQTLLFSATISAEIKQLAQRYMKHPVTVSAESYVDPTKLTQLYYDVPDQQKFSLLVHLLKHEHSGLVMVFCNTQHGTDFVVRNLQGVNIHAIALHGGFSQQKRNRAMEQFHSASVDVLVCTDVAARGLDIKGVSHIYNYDVPADPSAYIHRIGRTARAGKEGKAILILARRDYDNFSRLLKEYPNLIHKLPLPVIEAVQVSWKPQRSSFSGRGGRDGDRGSRGSGDRPRSGGGGFRGRRGDSSSGAKTLPRSLY